MNRLKVNLYEFLSCLSNAQDMVMPRLSNHHHMVAYLAYKLAERANLSVNEQKNVISAALIHDIGALSIGERLELIETEPEYINDHAFKGAKLLKNFTLMSDDVAKVVKYHHIPWSNGNGRSYKGEEVPFASHIIHLSDRICGMIHRNNNVLALVNDILSRINQKKSLIFEPGLVDILNEMGHKEYIWLDLVSPDPLDRIPDVGLFNTIELEENDITNIAYLFSQIIDFRSRFTAYHSAGVARTAERIAKLMGFSPIECNMMLIAGYLHDLGKLAIDNSVLEKPDKLDTEEYQKMRSHSYYTYRLLSNISSFTPIIEWASYHHERLDGKGYPFHIKGDQLSLGSRIMAVADVFTAVTENRPYRKSMEDEHAMKVLNDMVNDGALDPNVVNVVLEHFNLLNDIREEAQQEALNIYKNFLQDI